MKKLSHVVIATAALVAAVPAMAQFQKPEDAVKYRQSSFFVMGQHFGRLGAMANGKVPFDAKAAADNAAVVETLSKLPWAGFMAGTESLKSNAKPEMWTERAKFDQGAENARRSHQAGGRRQNGQPERVENRFCRHRCHPQSLPRQL